MSHKLSMSRAHLAQLCAYPFQEQHVWPHKEVGKAARVGRYTHSLIEQRLSGVPWAAKDVDLEELGEAKRLYDSAMTWIEPRIVRLRACELGLRYDSATDTCTRGPRRGEPGYDVIGDRVLPGTLDLVFEADPWEVVDVKTGKKQYETPWQLYAQAVAVSRLFKLDRIKVGYLYPLKTKCEEPAWELLGPNALDAEAGRIARILRTMKDAKPTKNDGCEYRCPLGRQQCPAWAIDEESAA